VIDHLINILFKPPPMPDLDLPFAAKLIPQIKVAIGKAFELAYYRGVYDGFLAGVLVTLLFVPALRGKVAKGVTSALEAME